MFITPTWIYLNLKDFSCWQIRYNKRLIFSFKCNFFIKKLIQRIHFFVIFNFNWHIWKFFFNQTDGIFNIYLYKNYVTILQLNCRIFPITISLSWLKSTHICNVKITQIFNFVRIFSNPITFSTIESVIFIRIFKNILNFRMVSIRFS